MFKLKEPFLLFIFIAVHVVIANAQININPAGKTYAVVIGISQYQNTTIPPLNYADKDATVFAGWLKSNAGGALPDYQVKLLINEDASISAIYNALDWLTQVAKQNDRVYLYFSGHGDVEIDSASISKGYLLAWNSPSNNYANNAIRVEDINKLANTLSINNKARVILITDACHSGKMAGDFFKGKQLTAHNLQTVLNNEVRMASCADDEEAAEGPAWGGGRGIFSYYLLQGLNGMGNEQKNDTVTVKNMDSFLASSFAADKDLNREKHKQHPVVDGNPYFPVAVVDSSARNIYRAMLNQKNTVLSNPPAGLQSLKSLGPQPLDYFMALLKSPYLETELDFNAYSKLAPDQVPVKMLEDCFQYHEKIYDKINLKRDSMVNLATAKGSAFLQVKYYNYFDPILYALNADTLKQLLKQLQSNKFLIARFNEKFIQITHDKAQDMINAYLSGDLAELEKRQYYYNGERSYGSLLPSLKLAETLVAPDNYLSHILKTQYSYISGLVNRLEMAINPKQDSLLKLAFQHLQEALQLEPYAPYIHNELGNLFIQKKNYDSAAYHYNLAAILAPTWAIPWSNQIRLNLALNNLPKAKEAIQIADSLQHDLAYVNVNAGLVMEKDGNWLAAESYYLNAIAQNNVHYLPFERLGFVYINTGEYAKADYYLYEAKMRKDLFAVNDGIFSLGIELGGPQPDTNPDVNDFLKERYLVGSGYEKQGQFDKAIQQFRIISAYENSWQTAQAAFNNISRQGTIMWGLLNHHKFDSVKLEQSSVDTNWTLKIPITLDKNIDYSFQISGIDKPDLIFVPLAKSEWPANMKLRPYSSKIIFYQAIDSKIIFSDDLGPVMVSLEILATEKLSDRMNQVDPFITSQYEKPIKMIGTIKAARLSEQMGNYLQAEQILLDQVLLNRLAANTRQALFEKGIYGPAGWAPSNYYWLSINRDMESETYNFYVRMINLFPRDYYWKEKAGIFLYGRLALTYHQVPAAELKNFYESCKLFAYPFLPVDETPDDQQDVVYELPGTAEKIIIQFPIYDPVKNAAEFLQQSIKLSGDLHPKKEILIALTELNSWMGNTETTIQFYKTLLENEPENAVIRNKYINYLILNNRYPTAYAQLDNLYKHKQIRHEQIFTLAEFRMKEKPGTDLSDILKTYSPENKDEKNNLYILYAKQNWLQGNLQKALNYLQDSIKYITRKEAEEPAVYNTITDPFIFRLYSIARLYAELKLDTKALQALKQVLDSGFNYKYVLNTDKSWERFRKTKQWNALLKHYTFEINYSDANNNSGDYHAPVGYRFPKLDIQ